MFTGIISEVGTIRNVTPLGGGIRITVEAPETSAELAVGDSVALNGACQTVVRISSGQFEVESVEETLRKTTLGGFKAGTRVNLELPLRVGDRLGGHIVQGHVDGVGTIAAVNPMKTSTMFEVTIPDQLMRYIIPVGSIAIDGISLTVASAGKQSATVAIIPHTIANTTLSGTGKGDTVNVEVDMIAKYIENLTVKDPKRSLNSDLLRSWGYQT
ncbi:MAG: riboflavin synthase [Ignavibacteria bacterium]|nr:riboflavin synthase [Ignavibacteria bacterium]